MRTVLQILEEMYPGQYKRKTTGGPHGAEYAGPCPFCGGDDRLCVWPDRRHSDGQYKGGQAWCRKCDKWPDAIQLLTVFCHMTMREALAEQWQPARPGPDPVRHQHQSAAYAPRRFDLPSAQWSEAAERLIRFAVQNQQHPAFQDFLRQRGLSLATAQALRFGYVSQDFWRQPEEWGEPAGKKVYVPRGFLLTQMAEGRPVGLEIRFRKEDAEKKGRRFQDIRSSYKGAWTAGRPGLPVLIVESILDAALVLQEAGDLVSAMALKGSDKMPDVRADTILRNAPLLLAAPDLDGSGDDALADLRERYPRIKDVRLGGLRGQAKDPGEMHALYLAGRLPVSVRSWIQTKLADIGWRIPSRPAKAAPVPSAPPTSTPPPEQILTPPRAPTPRPRLPAEPEPLTPPARPAPVPAATLPPSPPAPAPTAPHAARSGTIQATESTSLQDVSPAGPEPVRQRSRVVTGLVDALFEVVGRGDVTIWLEGSRVRAESPSAGARQLLPGLTCDPRVRAFLNWLPAPHVWTTIGAKPGEDPMAPAYEFEALQTKPYWKE